MASYGPPTSATQITNSQQSPMQYPTPNNQAGTQSTQTSQQSTVRLNFLINSIFIFVFFLV